MNTRLAAAAAITLLGAGAALAGEGPQATPSCGQGSGTVFIEYAALWPNSCVPRNPSVRVVGRTLELHATSTGGICLTVFTPYSLSGSVGGLCDGVYSTVVVLSIAGVGETQRLAGPDVTIDCSAADFNNDCAVSVQDIFDFLAAYFASDSRADVNGSGGVTVQDVFDYLAAYFAG